jgi:hypothetical protein
VSRHLQVHILYKTISHTYINAQNGNPKPILVIGWDNVLMTSDCAEIGKRFLRCISFYKETMSKINVEATHCNLSSFFFFILLAAKSYNVLCKEYLSIRFLIIP